VSVKDKYNCSTIGHYYLSKSGHCLVLQLAGRWEEFYLNTDGGWSKQGGGNGLFPGFPPGFDEQEGT